MTYLLHVKIYSSQERTVGKRRWERCDEGEKSVGKGEEILVNGAGGHAVQIVGNSTKRWGLSGGKGLPERVFASTSVLRS
jgi:hypothetical protein